MILAVFPLLSPNSPVAFEEATGGGKPYKTLSKQREITIFRMFPLLSPNDVGMRNFPDQKYRGTPDVCHRNSNMFCEGA